MYIDPGNTIVQHCAKGMELEALGHHEQAGELFLQAWNDAQTAEEKFIAAHYVARIQKTVKDKLTWDMEALQLARQIPGDAVEEAFPSLYLNIARGYEDIGDLDNAQENYRMAQSFQFRLPANGYGNMIKSGILAGMERVQEAVNNSSNKNYDKS